MSKTANEQLLEQLVESYVPTQELGMDINELLALTQDSGKKFHVVTKTLETPQGKVEATTLEPAFVPDLNPMSVYFMDQVLFDSEFFNKDAWSHARRYLARVKPDAVVLSGALLRIDRPEYKIDELVNFNLTEADLQISIREGDGLHDPLIDYMDLEFRIARKRFAELRRSLPDSDIYYMWSTDDGFSVNRMVHYLALRYRSELRAKISGLKKEIKEYEDRVKGEMSKIEDLGERAEVTRRRLQTKIESLESKLEEFDEEAGYIEEEQKYARPRKESPVHQMLVRKGTELIMGKYERICDRFDITFLRGESVIDVKGNKLQVKENARAYDSPIRNRPGEIIKSVSRRVDELAEQGIVATVEGHQGTYWVGRFDTTPSEEEVHGDFEGVFYPPEESYQKSVYSVILPVFHDQVKVKEFIDGERPERLSARKAVGNRNHFALKMFQNNGVSGLFGLLVDEEGRVGRDIITYSAFKSGKSLAAQRWYELETHADMHMLNPSTAIGLVHGARERRLRHLGINTKRTFRGKPLRVSALLTVGDCIEGNSSGWRGAGAESRRSDPLEMMAPIMQMVTSPPENLDEMLERTAWVLGFNIEGPRENMGDLLKMLANYYLPEIEELAEKSSLQTILTAVGSNHSYLTLRATGINPHEILMWSVEERGLSERAVFDIRDARSNTVSLTLGQDTAGKYLFGPMKTLIAHDVALQRDPSQSLIEFGHKFDVTRIIGGHYHVSGEAAERYRGKPNELVLAIGCPGIQRVTSTELYKSGIPRHKGTKTLNIPAGEDTGQTITFENTAPLLAHESRMSMRLDIKEAKFMNQYQLAN